MQVSSIGVMLQIIPTLDVCGHFKNSPGLRLGCKLNASQISSLLGGIVIPA